MDRRQRIRFLAGVALTLAVAAFILVVYSLLGRTEIEDIYLSDSREERFGWRYELLVDGKVREYEPEFLENGRTLALPAGTEAVRISRVMTEEIPWAELEWAPDATGVEICLDDMLLSSDFYQARRGADGFLRLTEEDWDQLEWRQSSSWLQMRMSLPDDYLGRELSVTTYFREGEEAIQPEYPIFGSEDTIAATPVVFSVKYNTVMTIYALLTLLLAGMFLLDVYNGHADGRMLLLCLYFLLLFLNEAYSSYACYYSVLTSRMDLRFLCGVYMVPLYFYLALCLTGWWKWPLCGGIAAWTLYEGVREFLRFHEGLGGIADSIGPGALAVLLAVAIAYCIEGVARDGPSRPPRKLVISYGLLAVAVAAVYVVGRIRAWGSLHSYLTDGVWMALCMGNYWPVVSPMTDIISYTALIVVVTEVTRRTIRTRETVRVLEERSRLSLVGYERVLRAEEATNAARHEMRHHMAVLSGLLQENELPRAVEYISSVTEEMDRLPSTRYSANILVNVIAGSYLDRAKAEGVQVEYSLSVPPVLHIPDRDLSVFLTNMLENALQACRKLGPGRERYIRMKMHLHENALFIGCVNSADDEQDGDRPDAADRERNGHGYGLEAMRRIAERYNSILKIDRGGGEFSVKSNLSLPRQD